MTAVSRAVEQLTRDHEELIEGRAVTAGPLLEQLHQARYSSVGAGGSRGAASGMVLNVKAFDLYEDIDGKVRAWLDHYRQPHQGELTDAVTRLHQILQAEDTGGRLEHRDEMLGMFDVMVYQIENLLDPPHEKELLFPCPECGERYDDTVTMEQRGGREVEVMTRQAALRIPVRVGRALVAECHACGKLWATRDDLISLAESAGGVVDFAALAASGL
ncbi:hypothetical protein MUN78_10275 [Leucobacter allii]|uniref:DUF7341 domain-containing protein n=1 Tax=Leucobacter allii TaxID=2932247 RepID=A0ABY4FHG4_9MICO|nr:hypothetical protein [Leucobacter allii]UOQ56089.1 hypothetical protein MUN78_10275 [Leucobacter allii]